MRFRPCIDIHNGQVKQIVGGSLCDEGDRADENFVSQKDGDFFAELYKSYGLKGGHIILLNPASSEYYDADVRQAQLALAAYPGGLQIGGGINADNAQRFIDMGASHVIATSFVFRDGEIDQPLSSRRFLYSIHQSQQFLRSPERLYLQTAVQKIVLLNAAIRLGLYKI